VRTNLKKNRRFLKEHRLQPLGEKVMKTIISSVTFLFFLVSTGFGTTITVPGDYEYIQDAIDASEEGDSVLVSDGTFTGARNKNLKYFGKAITVLSLNGPEATVIDCENDGRAFRFINGEGLSSTLEGFTVRNGYTWYTGAFGGGLECAYSSPTITGCIFTGNTCYENFGGGLGCDYSSAAILNCTVRGNSARYGGGICFGGISYPTIADCDVSFNTAEWRGGGINFGNGVAIISKCRITENTAGDYSGGIHVFGFGTGSAPEITNCLISRNSAEWHGGGIGCTTFSDAVISNCTITENTGILSTGGLYCWYSSPIVTDCILWANSGTEIYAGGESYPIVNFSDVEGGWPGAGEGNIDADPIFAGGGDYHLQQDSPCIDSGIDAGVYIDIDDDTRPQGGGFDMGADEYVKPEYDIYIDIEILTPVINKPGELQVRLTVTNDENESVTCEVFTRVRLPDGRWFPFGGGWIFGPYTVTIPPNSQQSGILAHLIPVYAPVGNYLYEANIGLFPDISDTATGAFIVQ